MPLFISIDHLLKATTIPAHTSCQRATLLNISIPYSSQEPESDLGQFGVFRFVALPRSLLVQAWLCVPPQSADLTSASRSSLGRQHGELARRPPESPQVCSSLPARSALLASGAAPRRVRAAYTPFLLLLLLLGSSLAWTSQPEGCSARPQKGTDEIEQSEARKSAKSHDRR